MKFTTILLATMVLGLWMTASAEQATGHVQTLRGADVDAADVAPTEKAYVGKPPGSQKPVERTFRGQPPVIPHSVEGFPAITLERNACLMCHSARSHRGARAPRAGDSHFRGRDGHVRTEVAPARNNCTACHVPQADAEPLVPNTFRGAVEMRKH